MGRLTFVALLLGAVFTLSYGTGAHIAVRYLNPPFGAWWNANEFAILECAAAAIGMLIGIRIGARLVDDAALKNRSMVAAVIVGAPCRCRSSGASARKSRASNSPAAHPPTEWLIDRFGYDTGMFLDKLLAAGVYSIKIAMFALPVGMILFGVAIAVFMTSEPARDTAAATSK